MLESYNNEDEQVAAIKKWWQQNAKSVLLGGTLGISLIIGWQLWQSHQLSTGMAAATAFAAVQQAETATVIDVAEQMMQQYPGTIYAALAARQAAKQVYQQGDKAAARAYLERALQEVENSTLQTMISLQLAGLLVDLQEWQAAETTLQGVAEPEAYATEIAMLRGDLAYHQGDMAAAYTAYQTASAEGSEGLLALKIAELAPPVANEVVTP